MAQKRRVLIVDDHALVREGMKSLLGLEERFEVAGAAADGREALDMTANLAPDVVIMDISMPGLGGADATRRIKRRHPDVRVLVCTVHLSEEHIFAALEAGADGYIVKDAPREELVQALDTLLSGQVHLSPAIADKVARGYVRSLRDNRPHSLLDPLTEREREVFQLIGEGWMNREIGQQLHISVKTVEKHRANIMRKLGVRSAEKLRALWRSLG
jgi:RNA polymerase sigma factor (sigma-70 family)